MNYWLVKSDPETYSWEMLLHDKYTEWDGVRNYQARNNLKLMKKGDMVLFYHSQLEKAIMGVAKISNEYFHDPTANEGDWVAVEIKPLKTFKQQVSLEDIKKNNLLKAIGLLKQPRLSVMPITKAEFDEILRLSKS
ncbi:EVE domain-containing protein [Bacteroidetes/Chlorobi group bacterium ChocPot_Mid]|nr:MAG: EVE domain-containing protein [Bacteroidetes/Chlorobi group bacterium ChocPot_Mid]